jgi:hypothetical protein
MLFWLITKLSNEAEYKAGNDFEQINHTLFSCIPCLVPEETAGSQAKFT